jgi:hypothetical protein
MFQAHTSQTMMTGARQWGFRGGDFGEWEWWSVGRNFGRQKSNRPYDLHLVGSKLGL